MRSRRKPGPTAISQSNRTFVIRAEGARPGNPIVFIANARRRAELPAGKILSASEQPLKEHDERSPLLAPSFPNRLEGTGRDCSNAGSILAVPFPRWWKLECAVDDRASRCICSDSLLPATFPDQVVIAHEPENPPLPRCR